LDYKYELIILRMSMSNGCLIFQREGKKKSITLIKEIRGLNWKIKKQRVQLISGKIKFI